MVDKYVTPVTSPEGSFAESTKDAKHLPSAGNLPKIFDTNRKPPGLYELLMLTQKL